MARWFVCVVIASCFVLMSSILTAGTGSGVASGPREAIFVSDREVDLTVESAAMGRPMNVKLFLPREWHADPNLRYPVLYLLSGYGREDNHLDWLRETGLEEFMADRNVLVVMPEAGLVGLYSDWWNYGKGGPPAWETFHTTELPEVIDRDWRGTDRRAIAGISMGGFGAMSYSARHPGFYRGVASLSGYLHTSAAPMPQFCQLILMDKGADPNALWGDPFLNADIWAEHDPYVQADKLRDTAIYISVGSGDRGPHDPPITVEDLPGMTDSDATTAILATSLEALANQTTREFAGKLDELGIPYTAHFDPVGTHSWPYYEDQFYRAWPTLAGALEVPA